MVHQRHGCEPAGRLHGTVIAVLTLAAVSRSARDENRTGRTASGMVFSARLGPPLVGSDPPDRLDTNAVWVDARQMILGTITVLLFDTHWIGLFEFA